MSMDDLRRGLSRHFRHTEPALTNTLVEIVKPSAKRVLVAFYPGNLQPYTVDVHRPFALFNGYTLYPNQPAGGIGASTIVTQPYIFSLEEWGDMVQTSWYGISNLTGTAAHVVEVFDDSIEFALWSAQNVTKLGIP